MPALWRALHAALLACLLAAGAGELDVTNSKQLRAFIYTDMEGGDACVRLLQATGQIGCAARSSNPGEGTLVRLEQLRAAAEDYPCTE